MIPARLAFIGLETTGANPVRDRITRVAVLDAEGDRVSTWSTLVNPQRPIPEFIQRLNGIRNETIADAPTFAQVAAELADRLHGRPFIAHHARFNYGFVKSEFQRLGKSFRTDVLCTVRLSRKLFPDHQKHNLDSLMVRHDLTMGDRHGALADAHLLWQFWCLLKRDCGEEALAEAIRQQFKRPSLPPHLDSARLDDLPESPGVYLFYGDNDALLYVGKSVNLRQRVRSHFASDLREYKEMRLSQEVRRIHWHETAGELGALLLESRLVKECQPIHNRRLRRSSDLCTWQLVQVAPGDYRPRLVSGQAADFVCSADLFGLFANRREATDTLRKIAAAHELCPIILGLEKPAQPGRPCFAHQVKQCRGACVGKEAVGVHGVRMMSALMKLKLTAWPYPGAIGVVERDELREVEEVHVVNGWRHLGSARSEAEIQQILLGQSGQGRFDRDTYKLLTAHLGKGRVRVRLLSER
ncbi:MAG TPA: exonuclease domain-containing protein [Candidatus Accumulibacter phosphatis]|uniref:3'-5' exonuclease family protein n=1 Tax=Accumulibacter sp. TaxID=2053492 RepID=UPI002588B7AC|nr:3'-5' exonuclease family protein [Accumulibacter sp.]HRF11038.1 exonuclease domain-containing protein [Candidatus Accumulibacter phosphatis]